MITNIVSQIFGKVAGIRFPKPLQNFINNAYVRHFDIDLSAFKQASDYASLNELFIREFVNLPPLELGEDTLISPCDGLCYECGKTQNLAAISVKGCKYSVSEFLKTKLESELNYLNIYLSPKDYHHYHAPCDMQILSAHYEPAKLYSVAKKWLLKVPNLYAKNERVILKCKLKNGSILWLVFVGALNVGKMKFTFDSSIQTNANAIYPMDYEYENLFVKQGERLGNFELGSTIVLLGKKVEFIKKAGDELKFGKTIATLR